MIPFYVSTNLGQDHSNPHAVATAAWPYMTANQRQLVDVVAKDLYRTTTTEAQRIRISGHAGTRYESLSSSQKAPFRGVAIE